MHQRIEPGPFHPEWLAFILCIWKFTKGKYKNEESLFKRKAVTSYACKTIKIDYNKYTEGMETPDN